MLKIQQRKNSDRWSDYAAAGNIDEVKQIIQEAAEKSDVTEWYRNAEGPGTIRARG